MTPTHAPLSSRLDARTAITVDLDRAQRERRTHFLPAALLTGLVAAGGLVITRVRPDLLDQPPAQLAIQIAAWIACLLVLPAIGVGLLFLSRPLRIAWIFIAIATTAAAVSGRPFGTVPPQHPETTGHGMGCLGLVLGAGALLLAIGVTSGAFVQRRGSTAVYWVAAGLAMLALNLVTWHCPQTGMMHIIPTHLGGAGILLLLAVSAGFWARRADRA